MMTDAILRQLVYAPDEPLLFNTALFFLLFVGFYGVYALLSGRRQTALRLVYVVAFSYYFYYKNAGGLCVLLAMTTLVNYLSALLMDDFRSRWWRRLWLTVAVVYMLGQLLFFNYTAFFFSDVMPLLGGRSTAFDIMVPLGISFFTFQSLSYIIDVYRREMCPTRNLLDFAFFVSFFPTLLSGPILRAKTFLPQLRKPLLVTRTMFGVGLWLIMVGLFKKVVISDYIGSNFVDRIFDAPELYTGIENLIALYGYAIKLYCDFSGYSDIAIGIALWMGFTIPDNFRAPYKADSITDFWHRWHISLSSWLRDYLYIPLGGSRHGLFVMCLSLLITMVLGGLWHGASWNFLLWGAIHGLALALHKLWQRMLGHDRRYHPSGVRRFFAIVLTFHLVVFSWLFFANTTFEGTLTMMAKIFTALDLSFLMPFVSGYPIVVALMLLAFVLHYLPSSWNRMATRTVARLPLLLQLLLFVALLVLLVQVKGSEVQPFIYLQF